VLLSQKGDALQKLGRGGCIALDKTGTLTADAGGTDLTSSTVDPVPMPWRLCRLCSEPSQEAPRPPPAIIANAEAEVLSLRRSHSLYGPDEATERSLAEVRRPIGAASGGQRVMTLAGGLSLRQQRGGQRIGAADRQDALSRPPVDGELVA